MGELGLVVRRGCVSRDRFAALGPSAGWIGFSTYGGARSDGGPLGRAASPSDTLALKGNYARHGIYVLHGDADESVPVAQARAMRAELKAHPDLRWHEQPGAKHWWDASDEPGVSCVDWPAMFDLFARRTRAPKAAVRHLSFATASPGVSARCDWLTIHGQERQHGRSSVTADLDPHKRRFVVKTENVTRLALDLDVVAAGGDLIVSIDGQSLQVPRPATPSACIRTPKVFVLPASRFAVPTRPALISGTDQPRFPWRITP